MSHHCQLSRVASPSGAAKASALGLASSDNCKMNLSWRETAAKVAIGMAGYVQARPLRALLPATRRRRSSSGASASSDGGSYATNAAGHFGGSQDRGRGVISFPPSVNVALPSLMSSSAFVGMTPGMCGGV